MILQTLDIKDNCQGIYLDGKFIIEPTEEQLTSCDVVWKHSPMLKHDENYRFLYLSTQGQELSTFSPEPSLFLESSKKFAAHKNAAVTAKVDLASECFFDLMPQHQLDKWFKAKDQALRNVLNSSKEEDYDILHKAHVLTSNIAHQSISFAGKKGRVLYNIFGSATGRLTTKKNSVPVLTLKKEQRSLLRPQNDAFVELDLNAAEIRTLLGIMNKEQPSQDIHEWIMKNVYQGELTREQIKVKVFSWLYNFSAPKSRLDEIFSRQIFRDFYLPEEQLLTTPFGRKIKVEERKAQNYLLQSATSDQVIENAYKIQKLLQDKKSNIAFTLHDSIILDMSKEDAIMLPDIKRQFEKTRWGKFMSTCKIGKDFGSLKELKI